MPELPEVETIIQGLKPFIEEKKIEKVELFRSNLRTQFPDNFVDILQDRKIYKIYRRAKYLIFILDNGQNLIIHLGMSGRLTMQDKKYIKQRNDHIFIYLENLLLVYNDARRFGLMEITDDIKSHKLFIHLGVEPLTEEFNVEYLMVKMQGRKTPIKVFLMDQKIIVGVGNIYVSELLFRAKIHPSTAAYDCIENAEDIVKFTKEILQEAIKSGGSTFSDFQNAEGNSGYFQHNFAVYGKVGKNCKNYIKCGGIIEKITQAGRASFFCPNCQR